MMKQSAVLADLPMDPLHLGKLAALDAVTLRVPQHLRVIRPLMKRTPVVRAQSSESKLMLAYDKPKCVPALVQYPGHRISLPGATLPSRAKR